MGADLRKLKKRIHSVESTRHITRAMQLVSASKMKRAGERLERCRAYAGKLRQIFSSAEQTAFPCAKNAPPVYIVIAGDRGLAGGYNHNIIKLAQASMARAVAGLSEEERKKYLTSPESGVEAVLSEVCGWKKTEKPQKP